MELKIGNTYKLANSEGTWTLFDVTLHPDGPVRFDFYTLDETGFRTDCWVMNTDLIVQPKTATIKLWALVDPTTGKIDRHTRDLAFTDAWTKHYPGWEVIELSKEIKLK